MSKYYKKEEMQKFLADVISFKIWDYDEEINRDTVIKKLYEIPTIDIVHCKECKHNNTVNCPKSWFDEHLQGYKTRNDDNDFCSDGERKDNE